MTFTAMENFVAIFSKEGTNIEEFKHPLFSFMQAYIFFNASYRTERR